MKKMIAFMLCIGLLFELAIMPAFSMSPENAFAFYFPGTNAKNVTAFFGMSDEEHDILMEHLGKLKQLNEFGSKPVGELLDDAQFKTFFENYARALTVIQVADKVRNLKDREALEMIGGQLSKEVVKYLSPDLAKALSWFKWAKTGMELFKDLVFDPWMNKQIEETYAARRNEGSDPEDAYATLFDMGGIRLRAEKLLKEKGYNPKLVGEKMLNRFICAQFEAEYQRNLLRQAAKKARNEAEADDQKLLALLREKEQQSSQNSKTKNSDDLGTVWDETESGFHGTWTRRGTSDQFDADWGGITAVLTITITGNSVSIDRERSSDGNDCRYQGTIGSDGVSVSGTYHCNNGGPYSWQATIK